MQVKKEPTSTNASFESKRLLSINEAAVYLGLGRSSALVFLEKIGAKQKIGRRSLYDKIIIDQHLSNTKEVDSNGKSFHS